MRRARGVDDGEHQEIYRRPYNYEHAPAPGSQLLSEAGHHVVPMPTRAALEFVGAPTWEALTGEHVSESVFDRVDTVNHVAQGQAADLVVIAPATADLMARIAALLGELRGLTPPDRLHDPRTDAHRPEIGRTDPGFRPPTEPRR